ncbi:class I SAM-dependent RNA methyltransferase [Parvularcula dongshanensis]|uniref:23S rRNA (Uracil1939-C5)-methyltransferase n=1 Tax=Parvularcula dongshanensis TaxID=1173995 RepID=A0A840I371_9PROT|nr:class I SAM-dependent RNA methyltransferase [Parvularcula dongshanensis]MBB4658654.1 23S rRNA (uracil1939-C5)-methyltransferase [Parvularcula dongshanensis]
MVRRARRAGRSPRAAKGATQAVVIERLGNAGDGLAGNLAVPFTLPDELVTVRTEGRKGRVIAVERSSPARAAPPCRHFGLPGDGCGGCKLQHLTEDDYRAWKRERLVWTLSRAGIEVPEPRLFASPPRSRRRAKLALRRAGGRVICGFRALGTDRIVDLQECHILAPALFDAARCLPSLVGVMPFTGEVEAVVTLTGTGIEVAITGIDEMALPLGAREAATRIATELDLARVTLDGVPLLERRTPALSLGGVEVALPSGAFLQATREGEEQITALVTEAVRGAGLVADLFCGVGTFALPLSRVAKVFAAEAAEASVTALRAAAKRAGLPIEAEVRDLFTRPLLPNELSGFGAVLLDPPRAGAAAQAEALARSEVPLVVYVSCDPGALSRDARTLSACYDLTDLSLVDQFLWSPHIEAVAVFRRREG